MRNMLLIARREYLERIRTKAFLIMTILIPAIMGGSLVLPALFIKKSQDKLKHLVVVASDQRTGNYMAEQINQQREVEGREKQQAEKPQARPSGGLPGAGRWTIDVDTNTSESNRAALSDKVKLKLLDGVIWATAENLSARKVPFITRDVSSFEENMQVQRSITRALQRDALEARGFSDAEIENLQKSIDLNPESPSGVQVKSIESTIFTSIFPLMVLYMSVLLYGINVMNAVLEEKSSRVMEVVLSSVEPKYLMAGKLLGVGAVGLTQIFIWAAIGASVSGSAIMGSGVDLKKIVGGRELAFFVVFYLLGYLLYSAMYAAVGAMCNSQQEAQQLSQLVTMPLVIPLFLIGYIIQYPGAPLSVAASLFPLTSPLMMYARIASVQPPGWKEIALSIALLAVTIYGVVLLCAKIYRVGILMYGKKPTLPEIVKWIKYA